MKSTYGVDMADVVPASELELALSPQTPFSTLGVPPPPMDDLQELVTVMKNSLTTLGHTFDTLGEQTAQVAALPSVVENANQVSTYQDRNVFWVPQS